MNKNNLHPLKISWLIAALIFAVITTIYLQQIGNAQSGATRGATKDKGGAASQILIKRIRYQPPASSKASEEGRALFAKLECASCHNTGTEGGCLGPPLAGEGGVHSRGFLEARLTNTKEDKAKFQSIYSYHAELMPHARFEPATVKKLVAYILTIPAPTHGYQLTRHIPNANKKVMNEPALTAANIAEGAKLYYQNGCAACHSIGNVGGTLAPAMDGIGSRRDFQYIADHVTDAQFHNTSLGIDPVTQSSKMPRFKASEKDIDQIAAFLHTLKGNR